MAVCAPMAPVRGNDDQAVLRFRLSASLDEARRELIDATERGEGGRAALARHAECIDGIIRELVDGARVQTPAPLAVYAVGGYGRKSQFLHSDIDLLVVFGGPIGRPEERFVKALASSAVGSAVRGRPPCARIVGLRSPRHDQSGISACAHGPSSSRRRPGPHRQARGGHEIIGGRRGGRRFSTRSWR